MPPVLANLLVRIGDNRDLALAAGVVVIIGIGTQEIPAPQASSPRGA